MGIFDIFSSSSKAVDTAANVIDKATTGLISGIDKLKFTEEEQSDASQKIFQQKLEFQKALMQEALPSAVSRRVLAWAITGVYLSLCLFSAIIWRFNLEWAKFIIEQILARIEFAFGAVISTYFIYHGIKQAIKK
jgi:hypothetical protein